MTTKIFLTFLLGLTASLHGMDIQDMQGMTLCDAVIANDIDLAKQLIADGANIDDKNNWVNSPLHFTAKNNNVEIAKLLLDNGADVNNKTYDGSTPLHEALNKPNVEVAKILIEKGANVGAMNMNKTTPLHIASHYNMGEIIKILIDRGANVNSRDSMGNTPLHEAACSNSLEAAQLLLENGANVNSQNSSDKFHWNARIDLLYELGATPLMYAAVPGHGSWCRPNTKIVQLLLDHGADSAIAMSNGKTVSDLIQTILETYSFSKEQQEEYQYILELCKARIDQGNLVGNSILPLAALGVAAIIHNK